MKFPELNKKNLLFIFLFFACLILVYKGPENYQVVGITIVTIQKIITLLSPFVTGLLLAYLLHIPCEGIEGLLKKIPLKLMDRWGRPISVLCLALIVIGFIVSISLFIIPALQTSIKTLIDNWEGLTKNAYEYIEGLRTTPYLSQVPWNDILNEPANFLKQIELTKLGDYAVSAVTVVFNFFVTLVVAIYILLNPYPFVKTVERIARLFIKEEKIQALSVYVKKTDGIFYRFISCQLLDALIIGTISGIVLTIMGVEYSILLAVTLAIFNIIPFFGAFFGVAVAFVVTFLTGGWSQALAVLVFLVALQQVDGNIIIPRLLGRSLNLNPVIIIIAISIGGALTGVMGMFLSVPVVAVCKIILGDAFSFLENRKITKKKQEETKAGN